MTEGEIKRKATEDARRDLQLAYRRTFQTEAGKKVRKDLGLFCNFESSTTSVEFNPNQTMHEEGKRRVYLRINSMIKTGEKHE